MVPPKIKGRRGSWCVNPGKNKDPDFLKIKEGQQKKGLGHLVPITKGSSVEYKRDFSIYPTNPEGTQCPLRTSGACHKVDLNTARIV